MHNTTDTDPEGQFIIINISISNSAITNANIYCPNTDDSSVVHNFCLHLSIPIIHGGDFNAVVNT